ncbi:MAG: GGDEF domain-containing protein, partial [Nitrosomonadales bacterium]|nr:GGDEF domain-containing protein [Nitrosomonadales bacterium]
RTGMALDVRTIVVVFAMLSLMFSGLFLFARLHAGNIRGVKQWAVASLCIGLGLGLTYLFHTPSYASKFAVVLGATLIATSIALQFSGIQAFKGDRTDKWLIALFVGLVALLNVWFEFISPSISYRTIANSLVFGLGYAACARILLIRIEPPLRSALWFTGLSFALLSVVLLIRTIVISQSQLETYGIYASTPINPPTFLIACLVQLCVTFGFLLMLNHQLVSEIQKIASRDMLTGAFNRGRLEEELARLQSRCERTGDKFAVMLIDVDDFKTINDTLGHLAGDELLRSLTNIAQTSIRVEDYFARFGGDEFCILLPSTSAAEAFVLAERLRRAYASTTMSLAGKSFNSTISIGVADSSQVGLQFESLIAVADQALYRAKQAGRNKVVIHTA